MAVLILDIFGQCILKTFKKVFSFFFIAQQYQWRFHLISSCVCFLSNYTFIFFLASQEKFHTLYQQDLMLWDIILMYFLMEEYTIFKSNCYISYHNPSILYIIYFFFLSVFFIMSIYWQVFCRPGSLKAPVIVSIFRFLYC